MSQPVYKYTTPVLGPDGTHFHVYAVGDQLADGTWSGWLEFVPTDVGHPPRRTGQETSQPSREALISWATGVEPIYLEGAFARATPV